MFIQFKFYKLQFRPLNDQITASFVRAAAVLAKGRMFDMPDVECLCNAGRTDTPLQFSSFAQRWGGLVRDMFIILFCTFRHWMMGRVQNFKNF
jgi:hypothetical protein